MVVIKWRRGHPFVYKSERINTFGVGTDEGGHRTITEKSQIKSVYLGSYKTYRASHPDGRFEDILTLAAKLKMLADHPEHMTLLREIDKEVCGK